MTYCIAIAVEQGLVFTSDSRTNAGVDNVSTYSKMHIFDAGGERQFLLLSAGNLATTQSVIQQLEKELQQGTPLGLQTVANMAEAADHVGRISVEYQQKHTAPGVNYGADFIVGGQIAGEAPEIYLVYSQGNYITTSKDTPYLQIGEGRYGKSILDRVLEPELSLDKAALCAMVSMDSTMRSNLAVGPPIEVVVYPADCFSLERYYRFEEDSNYLRDLKQSWDRNLCNAFSQLPPIAWSANWDDRRKQTEDD